MFDKVQKASTSNSDWSPVRSQKQDDSAVWSSQPQQEQPSRFSMPTNAEDTWSLDDDPLLSRWKKEESVGETQPTVMPNMAAQKELNKPSREEHEPELQQSQFQRRSQQNELGLNEIELVPSKLTKDESSGKYKKKVRTMTEQTVQPSTYEVLNEKQEDRLKGLDIIFSNIYLRIKENERHPLTQLHQRIIQRANQTQADKNTNEWDTVDVVQWQAGKLDINKFKNQWVCGYKNVITAAGKEFNIPPRLLAAVSWREVGGDPQFLDNLASAARSLGIGGKPANETSFGNLSIQLRRAAESLGYNPDQLGEMQRYRLRESLQEPRQNIFIAGKHLSDIRDRLFHGKKANDLTERDQMAIAGAYNAGPKYSVKQLWDYGYAGGYGRSAFNGLKQCGCFE